MKAFFFAICCLFLVVMNSAQKTNAQTKWLTHADGEYYFTIEYPSDWDLELPKTETRFFIRSYQENAADIFRDNINCIASRLPQTGVKISSLEEAIKAILASELKEFKIVKLRYIQWNGAETLELETTGTLEYNGNIFDIHVLQRASVIENVLFTVTFTAEKKSYQKHIETVSKILKSMKIT